MTWKLTSTFPAFTEKGQTMDQADVINTIEEAGQMKDSPIVVPRMKLLGVKLEVIKHD